MQPAHCPPVFHAQTETEFQIQKNQRQRYQTVQKKGEQSKNRVFTPVTVMLIHASCSDSAMRCRKVFVFFIGIVNGSIDHNPCPCPFLCCVFSAGISLSDSLLILGITAQSTQRNLRRHTCLRKLHHRNCAVMPLLYQQTGIFTRAICIFCVKFRQLLRICLALRPLF